MSSSAAPNAIRIPVIMEVDAATGQLKGFRRVAASETKAAADEMAKNVSGAERSVTTSMAGATKATVTFKDAIRGAGPAMSSFGAALGQTQGPLGTFARGLLSIAANGFTPLGIAIGGATALLGAFLSKSEESVPQIDKEVEKVDELTRAWEEATAALRALDDQRFGRMHGLTDQQAQDALSVDEARNRLQDALDKEADLKRQMLDLRERSAGGLFSGVAAGPVAAALRKDIEAASQVVRDAENLVRRAEAVQERRGQVEALPKPGGWAIPKAPLELEDAIRALPTWRAPEVTPEQQARAQQFSKETEDLLDNIQSDFLDTLDRRFKESVPKALDIDDDPREHFDFLGESLKGTKPERDRAEADAKRFAEAYERHAQSFGVAAAHSIESSLSQAFRGKKDWRELLLGLFEAVQGGIADALAAGLVEGSGLKKAAASLSEQIFSALAPAVSSAAGSAPTSETKNAAAGTPIIVVADFTGQADTIASQVSQRGARAVVAKAAGQGVAAGSIPSRRRR